LINGNCGCVAQVAFSLEQRVILYDQSAVRLQDSRKTAYSLTRVTLIKSEDLPIRPNRDARPSASRASPGSDDRPAFATIKGDKALKVGELTCNVT
jgi:hypothetical protein